MCTNSSLDLHCRIHRHWPIRCLEQTGRRDAVERPRPDPATSGNALLLRLLACLLGRLDNFNRLNHPAEKHPCFFLCKNRVFQLRHLTDTNKVLEVRNYACGFGQGLINEYVLFTVWSAPPSNERPLRL